MSVLLWIQEFSSHMRLSSLFFPERSSIISTDRVDDSQTYCFEMHHSIYELLYQSATRALP